MLTLSRISGPIILTCSIILSGCAGQQPLRYSELASSTELKPNTDSHYDHISYRYSPLINWNKYDSVIIDPVVIYQGHDNQFGTLSQKDRKSLADYMHGKFSESLQPRFREVGTAGTSTLRLKLTLAGADTTTPFVGTFTKFDLAGGPYNIVQSIRGKEGLFNGSIYYAVEIYDSSNQKLLNAYIAKQYPNAMNISASIGSLSAAETGIDKGADELATLLK